MSASGPPLFDDNFVSSKLEEHHKQVPGRRGAADRGRWWQEKTDEKKPGHCVDVQETHLDFSCTALSSVFPFSAPSLGGRWLRDRR